MKHSIKEKEDALKKLSIIELVGLFSSACTSSKIHVSQIAVLSTIALNPGCNLKAITSKTHLSDQHVCRIIKSLTEMGEVKIVLNKKGWRFYWLTGNAMKTINGIVQKMAGIMN